MLKKTRSRYFPQWLSWLIPVLLVVLVKTLSAFPSYIEAYYSVGIYPHISYLQRHLLGLIPFSIGDICYLIFWGYLILVVSKLLISLYKKNYSGVILQRQLIGILKVSMWIYIVFNGLWGLNYCRLGIASQLNLKNTSYTDEELKDLLCDVIDELNTTRVSLGDSNYVYPDTREMFVLADSAYVTVSKQIPFIRYETLSVKPSMLSSVVSYVGYSGYYNPFSGEAQVNTDLPSFYIPFVTCHEMAHQLGYASESEASFVGYLTAIHSRNTLFRYSALFELFTVANSELFNRDFRSALLNLKSLDLLVKRDRIIYRNYILGKQNYVEPVMKTVYDQYLKANQQKSGINSYNEVVAWAIDYKKKYGEGSLIGIK